MKAKKVTVKKWRCSSCKRDYRLKKVADACCRCVTCKKRSSEYTGAYTECRLCYRKRRVEEAKDVIEHAKKQLAQAERDYEQELKRDADYLRRSDRR